MGTSTHPSNKFKLSRRGRKLQVSDDQRTILALPKDIPERTWAEILQKEEVDLLVFDIREEILEDALSICYEDYMEKQNAIFTAHCAAQAWLKLINWHFYRHDPGEEPSAYPPCYIPKRLESWIPDEIPEPSTKDTWELQDLNVMETTCSEGLQKWPSTSSLEFPRVEEIPSEYWFPGKVNLPDYQKRDKTDIFREYDYASSGSIASHSEKIGTESEVLQKVTDYGADDQLSNEATSKMSSISALKMNTPVAVDGSLHGAGDSTMMRSRSRKATGKVKKNISRLSKVLPPIDLSESKSRISIISDCRLRNLRLDTQFEIMPQQVDTPPLEPTRRK